MLLYVLRKLPEYWLCSNFLFTVHVSFLMALNYTFAFVISTLCHIVPSFCDIVRLHVRKGLQYFSVFVGFDYMFIFLLNIAHAHTLANRRLLSSPVLALPHFSLTVPRSLTLESRCATFYPRSFIFHNVPTRSSPKPDSMTVALHVYQH